MRIVVAPNALKGSLTAVEAAAAMARGARDADPAADVREVPVADGGDGLLDALERAPGAAERRVASVQGPLGDPVRAEWLWLPDGRTAVIESARACGLARVPGPERDPLRADTRGVGELVHAALDAGARELLLGLGGSATSDGGAGMALALGARLLDADGRAVPPGGGGLARLARIDPSGLDPRLRDVEVAALCDVDNPLLGPHGAAAVYAPQKGADPEQVRILEQGLERLAVSAREAGLPDAAERPGAGAAGGLGFGAQVFLGAHLERGAERVLALCGLEAALAGADLVLTAEGALDAQTASGKAPAAVARAAGRAGVPCIAIAGSVDADARALRELGFVGAYALCKGGIGRQESIRRAAELLRARTREAVDACRRR